MKEPDFDKVARALFASKDEKIAEIKPFIGPAKQMAGRHGELGECAQFFLYFSGDSSGSRTLGINPC